MTERGLTDAEYNSAMAIALDHCVAEFDAYSDRDTFADNVHPEAFAEALDAFPDCRAADISDAIHAGIADYWDNHR